MRLRYYPDVGTFLSGVGASLIAGAILWGATHRVEISYLSGSHRRRGQIAGPWQSYHLSRDSIASSRPIWIEHHDEIRVSVFGRLNGTSRAQHGPALRYALSGYIRGPALRIYLNNRDAHEGQTSILYPNLLGGDTLVGILVGEDFDRQWYASPSIMSRRPLSEARLTQLAQQLRINLP